MKVKLLSILIISILANSFFFNPAQASNNESITKAELIQLVVDTLNPSDINNYSDCGIAGTDGIPQETAVCYAFAQEWIDDSLLPFQPNFIIIRASAAIIFVHIFAPDYPIIGNNKPTGYSDVPTDTWYTDYIKAAVALKITDIKPGKGAKFYPGEPLTKGRAQYWIKNIKKYLIK